MSSLKVHHRIAILTLFGSATASASTVNLLPNVNGSTQIVTSIANTVATGATMAGITVTANYLDINTNATSSETLTWTATGAAGQPGVTGSNFMLTEKFDTGIAASAWTLSGTSQTVAVTSVVLKGLPGNVVFDRSTDNITSPSSGHTIGIGTPGSDAGGDYTFLDENKTNGNSPYTVNVTYSDIIGLLGSPACQGSAASPNSPNSGTCGDLFSTLTFAFDNSGGAFVNTHSGNGNNSTWIFSQDTDIFGALAAAPEPPTLVLLGAGLLAIARLRRH